MRYKLYLFFYFYGINNNVVNMKKILLFVLLFFVIFNVKAFELDSKNVALVNLNTNSVVYEKDKDERVSVASLQKILTSIIAIENIEDLNAKVTIDKSKVSKISYDVYTMGLKDGEEVTYYDLLEATLLRSAGDAALYLALSVSDTEEEFASLANDKIEELGLENTVYKDPIGLEKDGQYSTAYDMAKILEYALKNKDFKEIFTTSKYKFTDEEFEFDGPTIKTKEMGADYIKGAKTGYTSKAGNCLASYIVNGKEEFILVTLNASKNTNNHFNDQKEVLDHYLENYKLKKIIKKNEVLATVKSSFGETINIYSDEDIYSYVEKTSTISNKYDGKEKVTLKNKNGDLLGKYYVYSNDEVIYEKNIYLNKNVGIYIPKIVLYPLYGILAISVVLCILKGKKKKKRFL